MLKCLADYYKVQPPPPVERNGALATVVGDSFAKLCDSIKESARRTLSPPAYVGRWFARELHEVCAAVDGRTADLVARTIRLSGVRGPLPVASLLSHGACDARVLADYVASLDSVEDAAVALVSHAVALLAADVLSPGGCPSRVRTCLG